MDEDGRTGFDRRLREARDRAGLDAPPTQPLSQQPHPLAIAVRIGAEMVATLAVACAIGYGLDWVFGIHRWLLLAFVPVGIAAGVRNMMRFATPVDAGGEGGRPG